MKAEAKEIPEDAERAGRGPRAIGERARAQGRRAARWGFGPETNPFGEGWAAAAWERGRHEASKAKKRNMA